MFTHVHCFEEAVHMIYEPEEPYFYCSTFILLALHRSFMISYGVDPDNVHVVLLTKLERSQVKRLLSLRYSVLDVRLLRPSHQRFSLTDSCTHGLEVSGCLQRSPTATFTFRPRGGKRRKRPGGGSSQKKTATTDRAPVDHQTENTGEPGIMRNLRDLREGREEGEGSHWPERWYWHRGGKSMWTALTGQMR